VPYANLQTEKEQAEMKELYKTIEQQSKTIKRFNRGEYGLCEYRASSFPHLYSNS